jgi:hypothetical protein
MLTLLGAGQGQNLDDADVLIQNFILRVTLDGGNFEAESCLNTALTQLNNIP